MIQVWSLRRFLVQAYIILYYSWTEHDLWQYCSDFRGRGYFCYGGSEWSNDVIRCLWWSEHWRIKSTDDTRGIQFALTDREFDRPAVERGIKHTTDWIWNNYGVEDYRANSRRCNDQRADTVNLKPNDFTTDVNIWPHNVSTNHCRHSVHNDQSIISRCPLLLSLLLPFHPDMYLLW